ncbi:Mov34/MPN/PAD-1 family protein [Nocardia cyriacigeorgica]|uniref:Mov34/MPN/PAD-1 family protein n=1 Tax=Nocardia cyriacigeorgica TaxID=135487 RepID=UPI003CC7FC8D
MLRRREPVVVRISKATVSKMHAAAEQATPKETGGLLLGWWEDGSIVIDEMIEVVDMSATGRNWTRREMEAQHALDTLLGSDVGSRLGYVGDWHSHPAPVGASRTDLRSLTRSSLQYKEPLALAIRLADNTVRVYVAKQGKLVTTSLQT